MKYIAVLVAVAVFAIGSGAVSAWEPPEDCEPEYREISGNTGTPCKPAFPEIQSVEYLVTKDYPNCIEEMVFRMPDLVPTGDSRITFLYRYTPRSSLTDTWHYYRWEYSDGYLHVRGNSWNERSRIEESAFGNPTNEDDPSIYLRPYLSRDGYITSGANRVSITRPRTDNVVALANACLALVRQEKADREHAVAVAQAEADAEARRQAEIDAAIREREQAAREAEAQARVAEAELAAAKEAQRIVAETELLRTQTLKAQLAHEEAIAGVLQDIARIRLAGQQDRARLTNEYLVRAEASAEAFNVEVEEIEATIQRYLDFNSELLIQLEQYRADIAAKLQEAEQDLAEQQARIEALGRIEETPEPGEAN